VTGSPTPLAVLSQCGLLLHAVVFLVLLAVLKMVLPKSLSGYDGQPAEL